MNSTDTEVEGIGSVGSPSQFLSSPADAVVSEPATGLAPTGVVVPVPVPVAVVLLPAVEIDIVAAAAVVVVAIAAAVVAAAVVDDDDVVVAAAAAVVVAEVVAIVPAVGRSIEAGTPEPEHSVVA